MTRQTATPGALARLRSAIAWVAFTTLVLVPATASATPFADDVASSEHQERQASEQSDKTKHLTDTENDDREGQWRGVAVDLGRIDVEDVLQPGQAYALATITVRNPGTVASSYRMGVQAIESDAGNPPAEWFSFHPEALYLEPDQRALIDVTIDVPRGSEPGDYETLVAAQLASDTDGPSVGGAAAARLTFTVAATPPVPEIPLAVYGVAVAIAATALIARLVRRYNFRIERRPTT